MTTQSPNRERILFVTGRMAEPVVREVVGRLASKIGFEFDVAVLGVSVAALLTPSLVERRLQVTGQFDRVILPGWCLGELDGLALQFGIPFERGPKDIYDLPAFMGQGDREPPDLSTYDIEILAEINHAPRLTETALLHAADAFRRDGADVIDLGCEPGSSWASVREAVMALRREGHRVSIDSFDRTEVEQAVAAGAELVLSCNRSNVDWAKHLPAEIVVIPDQPQDLDSVDDTLDALRETGARFRIDPILEPIGFGFAESVVRYSVARRRWPGVPLMMGIGNVTELTDVDSAGPNMLLAGLCQEIGVTSVLTTQVINWCRSAVAEFDLARRIMKHAVTKRVPPKRLSDELVLLRDPHLHERGRAELDRLAGSIKDPNFRVFAEDGMLHLMNRDGHWQGTDPFELFDAAVDASGLIDPQHAFYLGYELAKAATAATLGKRYVQDVPLRWGFLTRPEVSAHERRRQRDSSQESDG